MGGYRSTWAMCQQAARPLEGKGQAKKTGEEERIKNVRETVTSLEPFVFSALCITLGGT